MRSNVNFKTHPHSCPLCAIVSLAIITSVSAQIAQFPGTKSETKSPNGRYAIQNRDSENVEPTHTLFLLDKQDGSKTLIHSYGRNVEILWSPKSDAFVVNDNEGSNSARPLLYSLPWNDTKIDLLESLTVFLRGRHQENLIVGNDHVYLLARRWINSTEILCRLEAYGEASPSGSGFKRYYLYKIGDGFRPYEPKGQPN
jgi:hypothetical protein